MSALAVERRDQEDQTHTLGRVMIAPPISEAYWSYRVQLSETQAIVGFPKFGTIGIGFAVEDDWNTNLPYTIVAEEILSHISHNKGDEEISDSDCLQAIRLIQEAAREDREGVPS